MKNASLPTGRLLYYLFIITLVATIMLLRSIPKLDNLPRANEIEFILEDLGYCQRPKVIPLLQQPIQFSHVGKTGGTTVTDLLVKWQEQVLPGRLFHYYENFTLQGKLEWNCKGIDKFDSGLFLGHLGIGFCEKLIKSGNRPFVIITLRHPFELLRSAYQYASDSGFLSHSTIHSDNVLLVKYSASG